jgi:hypothetical protein
LTLLIATISSSNIVITADGLSRAHPDTGGGVQSTSFQKIFPLPRTPVAIAHCGYNILDSHPVSKFLELFIAHGKLDRTTLGVYEIALELQKFTDAAARAILDSPRNTDVIGFWVAGLLSESQAPLLYEICWPNHPDPKQHKTIVLGGDGQEFIGHHIAELERAPSKCHEIEGYAVENALDLHRELYVEAERKQNEKHKNIFGGHQHQLIIETSGWRWTKAPR